MKIGYASIEDAEWLDSVIKEEFPYTDFSKDKIESRIGSENFLVFVARQKNIILGFCELELFVEKKEARLNAVYVSEAWRLQKIGSKLVEKAVHEAHHKHLKRVFLLVKVDNDSAKRLYKRIGFEFEGMHDKELDGSKVEVWAKYF